LDVGLSFFFPDGFMTKALLDDAKANDRLTLAKTYSLQQTADGHITLYCSGIKEYHPLFRALGHPEWCDDPRFADNISLRTHFAELAPTVVAAFAEWKTADLAPRLEAEQVPFGPILSLDQLQTDPQIVHNQSLSVREHPLIGRLLEPQPPVRYSKFPKELRPIAPQHGEHNTEILTELGHDAASIAVLRAANVVG
jgi:crotonobetainyl-CoA:carnitine CoA-transferase CaiB-like acyl-CoA transferase